MCIIPQLEIVPNMIFSFDFHLIKMTLNIRFRESLSFCESDPFYILSGNRDLWLCGETQNMLAVCNE